MQARMAAYGNCPDAVATTFADQSRSFILFAAKRALPAFSRSSAADGVMAAWDSRVCTSGFAGVSCPARGVVRVKRHRPAASVKRFICPPESPKALVRLFDLGSPIAAVLLITWSRLSGR